MKKTNLLMLALVLALLAALVYSRAGVAQNSHQTTWEYKVFVGFEAKKDQSKLDALGAQGWELTHVMPDLSAGTYDGRSDLIFRRQR
jgi:hypothetical protein